MDDCIEFESDLKMAAVARAFVADRLAAWEVSDGVDEALLVVSELVGNAVIHARTAIQVRLEYDQTAIRLEVRDENTRVPTAAACPVDATSGRGLALVSALATAWGIDRSGDGKVIWAEVNGAPRAPDEDCLDLLGVNDVDEALSQIRRGRAGERRTTATSSD